MPKGVAPLKNSLAANTAEYLARNSSIPAFLIKLYKMVDDPETNALICWSEKGDSFYVNKQEEFSKAVLPHFFKHNNFASFVRQLNMYGFHKIPHVQQGVLKPDPTADKLEFKHNNFQRDRADLLCFVLRKRSKPEDEKNSGVLDMQRVFQELTAIRNHQMTISADMQTLQQNSQLLWEEAAAARARHDRHQVVIGNILRFLASIYSGNLSTSKELSRKRPLLIEPSGQNANPSHSLFPSASSPSNLTNPNFHQSTLFSTKDTPPKAPAEAAPLDVVDDTSATPHLSFLPIHQADLSLDSLKNVPLTTLSGATGTLVPDTSLLSQSVDTLSIPPTSLPLPTNPVAGSNSDILSTSPLPTNLAVAGSPLTTDASSLDALSAPLLHSTLAESLQPLFSSGPDPATAQEPLTTSKPDPVSTLPEVDPDYLKYWLNLKPTTTSSNTEGPISQSKTAADLANSMNQLSPHLDALSSSLGFDVAGSNLDPLPFNVDDILGSDQALQKYLNLDPELTASLLSTDHGATLEPHSNVLPPEAQPGTVENGQVDQGNTDTLANSDSQTSPSKRLKTTTSSPISTS
ncbi:Heat shock transcription factor [Dispira parvispora]|uniref:Heat shock transcription factor n=1 Tax=Dispira parvispora TaxID=1520584 RepID=A0A9W8AZY7_9FUNG|nr:Heat shock transcription factor [Dispira parvispora]